MGWEELPAQRGARRPISLPKGLWREGLGAGKAHADNILLGASFPDFTQLTPGFLKPPLLRGSAWGCGGGEKDLAGGSGSWCGCHRLTGHRYGGSIVCNSRWA